MLRRIDDHLSFDPEDHRFSLDGRAVPSVTQALTSVGIIDDRWFTEWAANKGAAVHLACQYYDEGDLDEGDLDPTIQGYLEGWKKFKSDTGFVVTNIEEPVYNIGLQYAGILDRAGYVDGKVTVVDIKTGDVPYWVGIQLAAYQNAMSLPAHGRLAVQLTEDGKWKPHWFKDRRDWDYFKAALSITQLKISKG